VSRGPEITAEEDEGQASIKYDKTLSICRGLQPISAGSDPISGIPCIASDGGTARKTRATGAKGIEI